MRHKGIYAEDESAHKGGTASLAVSTGVAARGAWTRGNALMCKVQGPGFLAMWRRCGSAEGLDAGRLCLRKWGFRRCEDICWIKTNVSQERRSALRPDAHSVLQHTKVNRQ